MFAVQEQIAQPGWAAGTALVFLITGDGRRTAEAFDGQPGAAALLHVEYTLGAQQGAGSLMAAVFCGPVLIGAALADRRLADRQLRFPAADANMRQLTVERLTVTYAMGRTRQVLTAVNDVSIAGATFQTAKVFVGVVILALFGWGLTALLEAIERRFDSWRPQR